MTRSNGTQSIAPKLSEQPDVTLRALLAELAERGIKAPASGNAGCTECNPLIRFVRLNNNLECACGRGEANRAQAEIDVLDFVERLRRRLAILNVFIVGAECAALYFG
jgi:hypothetical protein